MKLLLLVLSLLALFTNCASLNNSTSGATPLAITKVEPTEKDYWHYYSEAVFSKNLAINSLDLDSKQAHINYALESLKKGESFGKELDLIYNQMSDCYYVIGDMNNAIIYAKKSISLNKLNIEPYNRIYSIYTKFKMNKEAAQILNEYLTVNPETIYIHFLLGEHYLRITNDLNNAKKSFQNVINLSIRNSSEDYYREYSFYYLGFIAFTQKNTDIAIFNFKKVLAINKNNLNAIYTLALIFMENNNLNQAEKYANQYYSENKKNKKINSILGSIYYIKNQRSAAFYLQSSIDLNTFEAILSRGLFFEMINRDYEAEKILSPLLKINQNLIPARVAIGNINFKNKKNDEAFIEYLTAGVLLLNSKQYNEAEYYLLKALNLQKNDIVYYSLAKVYEETGLSSLAIYYYKKINFENEDAQIQKNDILLQIGLLYTNKKQYNIAEDYFNLVINLDPNSSKPYFCMGINKLHQKEYYAAEKSLKKSIELYDESEIYYFYLAVVYEKTNQFNEAIASLKKALDINPQSARAYNFLGYLYADKNIELERSFQLITHALEIEPENGAFIDSLGWVYYRKGDYHTALEKLLEAEQLLNESKQYDPIVYDHIGDTYEKLGNSNMAVSYWKKSIELEKNKKIQDKINLYDSKK